MKEFKLDKKYITWAKGAFVFFIAFLVLGFSLPLLHYYEGTSNPNGTSMIIVMCITVFVTVVFGFYSILAWRSLKSLPFADVAADDDGIWYMHVGKDKGLIPWETINRIKERPRMQRLDLLDRNNNELLRVEYDLTGFALLRNLLNEKAGTLNPGSHQSRFSTGLLYHLENLAYVVAISAFGILSIYTDDMIGGALLFSTLGFLMIYAIYQYLVTATGIQITSSGVLITYPFTTRKIPFDDIRDVVISDEFNSGYRMPEVWIITKNAKTPFKLKQIGADSNVIYKALREAAKL